MADGSQDYSHLFRSEGVVSDVDLVVDVTDNYYRYVVGDEEVELDDDSLKTQGVLTLTRGARTRNVGDYQKTVKQEEMLVTNHIEETVHGGVHIFAKFSAESIVGGAYANTIAGPYLRLAGMVDFMAWGAWAEIDIIRAELALLMIRSHIGYAHAAAVRVTLASRLIDDFQIRVENFGLLVDTFVSVSDVGGPGGGITMES